MAKIWPPFSQSDTVQDPLCECWTSPNLGIGCKFSKISGTFGIGSSKNHKNIDNLKKYFYMQNSRIQSFSMQNIGPYFQMNRTKWGWCHFNHFPKVLLDSEKKTAAKKLSLKTPSASSLEKCGKPKKSLVIAVDWGFLAYLLADLRLPCQDLRSYINVTPISMKPLESRINEMAVLIRHFSRFPGNSSNSLVRHSNIAPFTHHLLDQWIATPWNLTPVCELLKYIAIEYVSIFQFEDFHCHLPKSLRWS